MPKVQVVTDAGEVVRVFERADLLVVLTGGQADCAYVGEEICHAVREAIDEEGAGCCLQCGRFLEDRFATCPQCSYNADKGREVCATCNGDRYVYPTTPTGGIGTGDIVPCPDCNS